MRRFSVGMIAKLGLVVALLGAASGCELRGSAHVRMPYVVVTEAPPPPPPRQVVVVRTGHVWVEGHQRWTGSAYVWQDGYYERERAGYVYAPGRWQRQSRGNGHVWIDGTWKASGGNGRGREQRRDHRNGH